MTELQIIELVISILSGIAIPFLIKLWTNHLKNKKEITNMQLDIRELKVDLRNAKELSLERHDDVSSKLDDMDKKITKILERGK